MADTRLFACCDDIYFVKYAKAFVNSACKHENKVLVHILNPSKSALQIARNLQTFWGTDLFQFTQEEIDVPASVNEAKSLYAGYRFHHIERLLAQDETASFLSLDVDSIIRSKVNFPDAAIGVYLREPLPDTIGWENLGTRVAAGAVFFNEGTYYFAHVLSEKIKSYEKIWFSDQVSLYETVEYFKLGLKIHDFSQDKNFLDWEFHDDGIIWTGKGDRKHSNKTYLKEFRTYDLEYML